MTLKEAEGDNSLVKQVKAAVLLNLKEWYQDDDIQKLMKIRMLLQWNLFITDTLMQGSLSVIKRCPLLGGWFKNASVTHIKYYYNVMKYI